MRTEAPLLTPIFRSDSQARLLAVMLIGTDELSLTDLAEHANLTYPTAHREAGRLLDAGILAERKAGRTRMLRANPDSPLVAPLRQILLVTAGPVPLLAQELSQIDGVERAFIYGSYATRMSGIAGPPPNDIDLMVVGTPDATTVYDACSRVEEQVGRPVNPTILTRDEFNDRSGFLQHIDDNPTLRVLP